MQEFQNVMMIEKAYNAVGSRDLHLLKVGDRTPWDSPLPSSSMQWQSECASCVKDDALSLLLSFSSGSPSLLPSLSSLMSSLMSCI